MIPTKLLERKNIHFATEMIKIFASGENLNILQSTFFIKIYKMGFIPGLAVQFPFLIARIFQ